MNADAPAEVLQPNVTAAKVSPDEATRAVAVSPASTTPGDVTAGQQPPQPSGAVGMGGGLGGAVGGAGRGTPVTGGISERSVTADINAGILPADALVIGKGWNAQKAADNGRSLINRGVNPAEVVQAISDPNKAMPRVGGRPLDAADAVSVIHAERERFAGTGRRSKQVRIE